MSTGDGSADPEAADFLAIVGPTAAGKTALALAAAGEIGGEIVSMDSRQVYRGMDVGTAKPTARERERVRHHGLDIRDPGERYGAGQFARDARRWIADARSRGRTPMLVGGAGLFLRALTRPVFKEPRAMRPRRDGVEAALERMPRADLARWARALDRERGELAVAGGRQRMTRTVSVALLTGRPLSWWHRNGPADAPPLRGCVCLLDVSPELLRRRIDERLRAMAEAGFADEVARLLDAGWRRSDPGMNAVGYREMADHVRGRATLGEALERARRATWRYARRQRTWFRHQLGEGAHVVDGALDLPARTRAVVAAWRARAPAAAPARPPSRVVRASEAQA